MNNCKYEFNEKLGSGSFGDVFLATEKATGKKFAIKTVDNAENSNSTVLEVSILKKTRHSNIIKYYESFYNLTGKLCIVLEYADYGTFEAKVSNGGCNKDEYCVWRVISHISSALDYLHKLKPRHILHRDLKPANVLGLTVWSDKKNKDEVSWKIADFGIAKLLNVDAQGQYYACTLAGTPIYMAPEVYNLILIVFLA
jgi:serine/threonine protein kinase